MAALERVSLDLVPEILQVLKSDLPAAAVPCQMLEMYVRCQEVAPDLDVRLYTPGGMVDAYGTYIIHVPEHRGNTVLHSSDPDKENLIRRIRAVSGINWATCRLGPLHNRFHSLVMEIMSQKGLSHGTVHNPADNLSMTREQALLLDAPLADGLELRAVTAEQAVYIDAMWPYRGHDTLKYIQHTIATRGGIALYKKGCAEMLSWALFSLVGGVGMMQTAEAHRCKGYGEIVARALTKQVAEHGFDPQVQVQEGLNTSNKMFTRIGYSFTHKVAWYWYEPS